MLRCITILLLSLLPTLTLALVDCDNHREVTTILPGNWQITNISRHLIFFDSAQHPGASAGWAREIAPQYASTLLLTESHQFMCKQRIHHQWHRVPCQQVLTIHGLS